MYVYGGTMGRLHCILQSGCRSDFLDHIATGSFIAFWIAADTSQVAIFFFFFTAREPTRPLPSVGQRGEIEDATTIYGLGYAVMHSFSMQPSIALLVVICHGKTPAI
jgi:hypothetical protein